MRASIIISIGIIATALALGCKKAKDTDNPFTPVPPPSDLKKDILSDLATDVIYNTYNDLAAKSDQLYTAIGTFSTSNSTNDLNAARQAWRDTRSAWEQSEGFLFGPVSTDNIDPRIDTWPINYNSLDSILASSATLDATYVNNLEEALKGFHPIEYLLFGTNGNKQPADFTARELQFLLALADNLKTLTHSVKSSWDASASGNYSSKFTSAGSGSSEYPTIRSAYEEVTNAAIDICDEVANEKIQTPFSAHDASLEESPYAKNSFTDFINNIKSVQNIYLGRYTTDGVTTDGKGLEDLIKGNNLSMDGQIKTKLNNALNALNNIPVPFGEAVTQSQYYTQVANAQTAINDLKDYLQLTVLPYVQTLTN
ncbi:MAG: peptidase M75 [Bacteroidetes bacterium]|nr:peptidase M75 [Bacteroidota bacterium]